MKKHTYKFIKNSVLLICMALSIGACKKVLDVSPQSFNSTENFYKTEDQLNSALNGVYATLNNSALYGDRMLGRMGLDADEGFNNNDTDLQGVAGYNVKADDKDIFKFWQALYGGITNANLLLENINKPAMKEEARNKIKGQAIFLRSYFYFLLVSNFGNVPLIIKSPTSVEELYVKPTPAKQVYEQILMDMELAASLVDDASAIGYGGRVSKSAVWGIMARVCLHMAGNPVNDQTKYALAKTLVLKVMGASHSLNTSYQNLFINYAQDKYDINESIWEVEFFSDGLSSFPNTAGLVAQNNGIRQTEDNVAGYVTGLIHPVPALYNLYSENDLRRDWVIAPFYYNGNPAQKISWTGTDIYQRNVGKWRREYESSAARSKKNTPQNFPILRYSDVLLMYAEADNESASTPSVDAINAVNTVRQRTYETSSTGKLRSIKVVFPGINYTYAPIIIVRGGAGNGATAVANILNASVSSITITDPGSNYTSVPTVYTFGSGTQLKLEAEIFTLNAANLSPEQTASKEAFRESIQDERSRELAFECLRKGDLVRWGIFLPKMKAQMNAIPQNPTPDQARALLTFTNASAKDVLWPIPTSELMVNRKLKQNFGW